MASLKDVVQQKSSGYIIMNLSEEQSDIEIGKAQGRLLLNIPLTGITYNELMDLQPEADLEEWLPELVTKGLVYTHPLDDLLYMRAQIVEDASCYLHGITRPIVEKGLFISP